MSPDSSGDKKIDKKTKTWIAFNRDVVMHLSLREKKSCSFENCFISAKCNRGNRGTSTPWPKKGNCERWIAGNTKKLGHFVRLPSQPPRSFLLLLRLDYLRLDRFQDRRLIFSRPDAAGNSSQNFSFCNPLCFSPFETWLATSCSSRATFAASDLK